MRPGTKEKLGLCSSGAAVAEQTILGNAGSQITCAELLFSFRSFKFQFLFIYVHMQKKHTLEAMSKEKQVAVFFLKLQSKDPCPRHHNNVFKQYVCLLAAL